jgi:prefoldin subunit 5
MENNKGESPKKKSNLVYYLIAAIIALAAADCYMLLQKNKSEKTIVSQNVEKKRLQTELDSLEAQIEQINASKTKMTTELTAKNDSLTTKIRILRGALAKGKLTLAELIKARDEIKQLRFSVTNYSAEIEQLKKQNASLTVERDTLKTNLAAVNEKATTLQKQNQDLDSKVKVASAIKLATADVAVYKIKHSGREVEVTRASPAKKIKISFTIAENSIAEKGMHDIYARIIDPTGNLITGTDSGTFTADGTELQFTYKTSIDFKDDGSTYPIDWENPVAFQKGTYMVLLYADGYTMGKTSFTLK